MTFLQPRSIDRLDVVGNFDSGEPSLNHYLIERGLANHVSGFSRCYVSVDSESGEVAGYYTLSAVAIERAELPGRVRRNAPNPVPAVLLGRLAIDRRWRGQGLAKFLVRDAMLSTVEAAERVGVKILLVYALHSEAASFWRHLGFQVSPTDPLHLYVLLDDVRATVAV